MLVGQVLRNFHKIEFETDSRLTLWDSNSGSRLFIGADKAFLYKVEL